MLIKLIVVIILQDGHILNHYFVHFVLYFNKTGKNKRDIKK